MTLSPTPVHLYERMLGRQTKPVRFTSVKSLVDSAGDSRLCDLSSGKREKLNLPYLAIL